VGWSLLKSKGGFAAIAGHFLLALSALALPALASAQPEVKLAAAADLEPVLPPILARFAQATGIHVAATYQASAMLTVQMENGAPFDLFLAANMGYPERLARAGLAATAAPVPYALGTLVLWTRKDAHLPHPSLGLLRNPALRRLAIANPDRAPYGRAAVTALTRLKLYEQLKPRIVMAENIAQAAQFVGSGNAEAGLISLTSALTPQLASSGSYFVMPRNLYSPLVQGAVVLKRSPNRAAAEKLLDYLLSAPVQAELARGGLTPVSRP